MLTYLSTKKSGQLDQSHVTDNHANFMAVQKNIIYFCVNINHTYTHIHSKTIEKGTFNIL